MPSGKAATSKEARHTRRYVEPLRAARTPLADFLSLLLGLQGSFFGQQHRMFHSRLAVLQRHTFLRDGLDHDVVFYSFSGPDNMEVVVLRENSQFAIFPPAILHPDKPEIVELCQCVESHFSVQCLLCPWIELRLV